MRKKLLLLASVALSVMVALSVLLFSGASNIMPRKAQAATGRPNFVFILADDMRKDDLRYMPKTQTLLRDRGIRFADAHVSYALCSPSRATIMRGEYAHNTGVWGNKNGRHGGWKGYRYNGNERDNVATRLDAAGYRTAYFGKYFNKYDGSVVPRGWDKWFGTFNTSYLHWNVNDNGTIRHVDESDGKYLTDVLRSETQRFIDNSSRDHKPFFAYVGAYAPHKPAIPAPRDRHTYDGLRAPRWGSFNERDVSDKPPWIRKLPRLSDRKKRAIDHRHEKRAESLRALDDLVGGVVHRLRDRGQLNDTYIVFTSDNGYELGQHRIAKGKSWPYEESIRMPLLIRGPGVQAGSTTNKLALNTDYFPTFTDLAGVPTPSYVDGRSLRPILKGNKPTTWRSAILLESRGQAEYGIRTSKNKKYVEYQDGPRELYNLNTDPYELRNSYKAGAPPTSLARRIDALKRCSGESCRSAENGR